MNFEDDAVTPPTNVQLTELSNLVEHQLTLEDYVAGLTEKLKLAKKDLAKVQNSSLPEMMSGLGFDQLKTTNGKTVEIARGIDASVTQANKEPAFKWLKKKGHQAIIKTELKLVYTGKEVEKMSKTFDTLDSAGIPYALKEGIHPGTLKAFVKEELNEGHQLPDSITVFEYGIAKISG